MQNLVLKIVLILAILAFCTWSIVSREARLGKDLEGGVSLVYQVEVPDDADPGTVVNQVIEVLKDRVNPTGVLDISFQRIGTDRIEIVMPLPDDETRALGDAYKDQLETLVRSALIRPAELRTAIATGSDEVRARYGADETTGRGSLVAAVCDAIDARAAAQAAIDAASGASDVEMNELSQTLADAEIDLEEAENDLLITSLSEARVLRVLRLPTTEQRERDDTTGETITRPSQRAEALTRLNDEFGHVSESMESLVEKFDTYQSNRMGFDDPEDLMRLLRGAGVLEFRVAVEYTDFPDATRVITDLQERGPDVIDAPNVVWRPLEDLKQWYETPEELATLESAPEAFFQVRRNLVVSTFDGEYYMLLFDTPGFQALTHEHDTWSLSGTGRTVDSLGRPAVSFALDATGARLMGRLTGQNTKKPMAIVLDDSVYSAPTIQSQITASGIITGNFSQDEVNYLIRVLAAGALAAQLDPDPIAMNTLGPSIGKDNLDAGFGAFKVALVAVAIFMLLYYFFAGVVADIALLANGLIIFGVMMALDATFTLPGLAGIVLTIGMAVDANVLIYERIREEIFAGELDVRGAIREGYAKAFSTIIDANVTNLIICFVLFRTATTEVKGFAVTLSIGIFATLFTALFVTRQIYHLYTDVFGAKKLAMLPTVVPAIHRALEPNINWIGLRKGFWTLSVILLAISIGLVASQGKLMFDTEFRGGVAAEFKFKDGIQLRQVDVEQLVKEYAPSRTGDDLAIEGEFADGDVLTVGDTFEDADGFVVSNRYQIKVANPKGIEDDRRVTTIVVDSIKDVFGDQLDIPRSLTFTGDTVDDHSSFTFPIELPRLGDNMQTTDPQDVSEYLGGVLVFVDNIDPPSTIDDITKRIDYMAQQPDHQGFALEEWKVIGLQRADENDPDSGYVSVAIAMTGPVRYDRDAFDAVEDRLASPGWDLVQAGLKRQPSLERITSFSSAVAQTLSANAIVSVILSLLGILAYIWVRFGSLRYSLAAIVALVHDVTIALGLLALSGIIGKTAFAAALGISPFRIDLGVVAALLTIIGYSLNDTIVILDRIRENRGKRPLPTADIVNRSINQTVSRTLLTTVTTLIAVGIMYAFGGTGIRPFAFCLLIGLVVGTYSSVAIAAPLVFLRGTDHPSTADEAEEGGEEPVDQGLAATA